MRDRIVVAVVLALLFLSTLLPGIAGSQPGGIYEPDPFYEPGPAVGGRWTVIGFMLLGAVMVGIGKLLEQQSEDPPQWGVIAFVLWIVVIWVWGRT